MSVFSYVLLTLCVGVYVHAFEFVGVFHDPFVGTAMEPDVCQETIGSEHALEQNLQREMEELQGGRRFSIVFAMASAIAIVVVLSALFLVQDSASEVEELKQFRALLAFRHRFDAAVNELEGKMNVPEINFTFRRRDFAYRGQVRLPTEREQARHNPSLFQQPIVEQRALDFAFPRLDPDELETLEGRTDFHALEQAGGRISMQSMRPWHLVALRVLGQVLLILVVLLVVAWPLSKGFDLRHHVTMCNMQRTTCRPWVNAVLQQRLETLTAWGSARDSEAVRSASLAVTGTLVAAFLLHVHFSTCSRQFLASQPPGTVHVPRSILIVFAVSLFLLCLLCGLLLCAISYNLKNLGHSSSLLIDCLQTLQPANN